MKFNQETENALAVTQLLMRRLGVKFTYKNLKKELTEHPDYPSILSITDTLRSFKIDSLAVQIASDNLKEIPTPCIAAVEYGDKIFALIKSVKNEIVEWWHYEEGLKYQKIEDFTTIWKGALVLVESTKESIEKNYKQNRLNAQLSDLNYLGLIMLALTVILIQVRQTMLFSATNMAFFFLLIIKMAGVGITSLLLWHLLDNNHSFLKNICQTGKTTDCNAILQSNAASIGGVVSWSEVGFFYFSGSFLALLLSHNHPLIVFFITVINVLALPYTFYSVYYQAFIAKQWCKLCLAVQILLWLEFLVIAFSYGYCIPNFDEWINLIYLIFYFGLPISIWFFAKPILRENVEIPHLKQSLRKFQNNPSYFNYSLSNQNVMQPIFEKMPILRLGKKQTKTTITVVTNPYCSACSDYHATFESLIEENADLINGQIIFASSDNPEDERNIFVRYLFSIDESKQLEALGVWFKQSEGNFENWKKQFPISNDNGFALKIIEQHNAWSKASDVQFTPTFFINGYALPELYTIEDVKRIAFLLF